MIGFSFLMFAFSAVLLVYAGLLALTKDYKMLPFRARQSVRPKDKRRYTVQIARIIALVAIAPLLSGFVGFWSVIAALVVLVAGIIAAIWFGTIIIGTQTH